MPKKKFPDLISEVCPDAFPPLREGLKGPLERFAVAAAVEVARFADRVHQVSSSARPHLSIDILLNPVGPGDWEDLSSINLRLVVESPGHYAVEFGGDLPRADVLIMGMILHDWNLTTKRMLVKKAYDALEKGGSLIVYEFLIDDERRTHLPGLLMSLNMLIESRGGFDYTGADCMGWMREAGFTNCHVVPLTGPHSAVIGVK